MGSSRVGEETGRDQGGDAIMTRSFVGVCTALGVFLVATGAYAQDVVAPAERPERPEPPKAPSYSLPWQLRSVTPSTGFRSDTTAAKYEDNGASGGTTVV